MTKLSPQRRHLLYFAPCDPRQGMGGGARLNLMLRALEEFDAHIWIAAYVGGDSFALEKLRFSAKITMIRLGMPRKVPRLVKLLGVALILVYTLLKARAHSLVIAHSPGVASGLPALVASRLVGSPLVVDHMDAKDPDSPEGLYRLVLRSANLVFAISRALESEVKALGGRRVVYLPIFLDLDRFQISSTAKVEARARLGLGNDDLVVGYFGSYSRLEGLPVLLEAFAKIQREMPRTRLLLVGSRNVDDADDVEGLVGHFGLRDKVILLPAQPYASIPNLLAVSTVLVSPKIEAIENRVANPVKIYEYLASGIPCIASDIGEAAELIRKNEAGYVVKPQDPSELCDAIRIVLTRADEAQKRAQRGRKLVEQGHSLQSASRRIEQSLSDLGRS